MSVRTRLKDLAWINRYVLPESTAEDFEFKYIDISAVSEGSVTLPDHPITFDSAPSRARRLARAGDVLVSTVRTHLRAISPTPLADFPLVYSTGFAVLEAKPSVDARWLAYACLSESFVGDVQARSVGVNYPAVNSGDLGDIHIHLPGVDEQRRIADFLDAETSRLDQLTELRARQLTLLESRDQAMLDATLISSFDTFVRLSRLADIQGGVTLNASQHMPLGIERPYLRVANVKADQLDLDDVQTVVVTPEDVRRSTLRPGDVLMTEGGDLDKLGRGTVWNGEIDGCLHQNHVFAVRPHSGLTSNFLALITRTTHARAYFERTGTKTTNLASTNRAKILAFPVPALDKQEQELRASRAAAELDSMLRLRSAWTTQRSLLQERKQALITAAVSGQIDVTTARGGAERGL